MSLTVRRPRGQQRISTLRIAFAGTVVFVLAILLAVYVGARGADRVVGDGPALHAREQPIPGTSISVLPRAAASHHAWNGTSFIQSNLWTDGETQYAVWVDEQRHPVIAKRVLPSSEWEVFDLSLIDGNPLASPVAEDNHNVLSVAVDSAGYVHVTGNMHNDSLRYVRTTRPGDISVWSSQTMTARDEDSVTYPRFVLTRRGNLLFFHRNGVSGDGSTYVSAYDVGSRTWERRAHLFDGSATDESPYLNRVAVGDDGSLHAMVVWRAHGGAVSNSDPSYAVSHDEGRSWERSDGRRYELPITHRTVEVITRIPHGAGLLNQNGLDVDHDGYPHGAYLRFDDRGRTQIHHATHDGDTWRITRVTSLSHRMDTSENLIDASVSRPAVAVDEADRVWIIYLALHDYPSQVRGVVVDDDGTAFETTFLRGYLHTWEPTFDPIALRTRNELHMLAQPLARDGSRTPANGFGSTEAVVASIPMERLQVPDALGAAGATVVRDSVFASYTDADPFFALTGAYR